MLMENGECGILTGNFKITSSRGNCGGGAEMVVKVVVVQVARPDCELVALGQPGN